MSSQTTVVQEHEYLIGNKVLRIFKMINKRGAYVKLTNFGATIINLVVPDRFGALGEVILGYADPLDYLTDKFYTGSTIGRYANRISNGNFRIDDQPYQLELNDGKNTNHSGSMGYHQRFFDHVLIPNGIKMTLTDKDGNGGFPGTLKLEVSYTWDENNALNIQYKAETDKPTIANFTNHAYFNLPGNDGNILNNQLNINSGTYLESNKAYLPTGKIAIDTDRFVNSRRLSDIINPSQPIATGLNRYFVLLKQASATSPQAILYDEESGRELRVFTSYPGIMVYTGQYLDKPLGGICLECQHYPDSINHQHFPQAILRPGQTYNEFITYQFNVKP